MSTVFCVAFVPWCTERDNLQNNNKYLIIRYNINSILITHNVQLSMFIFFVVRPRRLSGFSHRRCNKNSVLVIGVRICQIRSCRLYCNNFTLSMYSTYFCTKKNCKIRNNDRKSTEKPDARTHIFYLRSCPLLVSLLLHGSRSVRINDFDHCCTLM